MSGPVAGGTNMAVPLPVKPNTITATQNDGGGIELNWQNSDNFNPANYTVQVWKSGKDGSGNPINNIASAIHIGSTTASTYTDTVIEEGQTSRYYWLRYEVLRGTQTTQTQQKIVFSNYEPSTAAGVEGGSLGSGASKTVRLNASQYVIPYTLADTESATITFTASATNFGTDDRTYNFYVNNVLKQATTNTDDEEEFVLADGDEPANGEQITVKVEIIQGSTTVIDSTSIYGIKDGAEAFTVILDNEAHTIPATETGAPITFSNSGTNIKVFLGTTALDYGTSGANTFSVTANASGITKGTPTGSGTNWYSGVAGLPMAASTRSATITYSIVARNGEGTATTFTKIQSFSKGNDGAPGLSRYTWIKYATNATGTTGFTNTYNPGTTTYVGYAYNKTTATESSDPTDYTWSRLEGQNADGNYTWIKYATNATGTTGFSNTYTAGTTLYIGMAFNNTTATESSDPTDYTWSKIEGEDGIPSFTWVKYATNATGSTGFSNTYVQGSTIYIGHAYNKTTATESSNYTRLYLESL